MTAANLTKLAEDALTILGSALSAASGASVVTIAIEDAAVIKDAFEQLVLLIPPIDAAALDPVDRADADASAKAAEDAKFPPTSG